MFRSFSAILISGLALAAFGPVSASQTKATYKTIYNFGAQSDDGLNPEAELSFDGAGTLYGTTYTGGPDGDGTVFKVAPDGTETVLHAFTYQGGDGSFPLGGVTVVPSTGELYGTTQGGGSEGYGAIWRIRPSGKLGIIYSFHATSDGGAPIGRMVRDRLGNFYGVTQHGGQGGNGTVWKLTPSGAFSVLYSFGAAAAYPSAGLTRDSAGNLYGVAWSGGGGYGVVFKIAPDGTETTLHSFTGGVDGGTPEGAMVRDKAGDLYGTAFAGGANGYGTVWELAPDGTFTVLHAFAGGKDGAYPSGNLLRIHKALYGTTTQGGGAGCPDIGCGTVYKLRLDGSETLLHRFTGYPSEGEKPVSGLARGERGVLYGVTEWGGGNSSGTVFSVTNK